VNNLELQVVHCQSSEWFIAQTIPSLTNQDHNSPHVSSVYIIPQYYAPSV